MSQLYIICFDVHNKKRLRKVAIQMENFGTRVQYSVFECFLEANDLAKLKKRIKKIIDPKYDHIRYYGLCAKDQYKIQFDGRHQSVLESDYHLF